MQGERVIVLRASNNTEELRDGSNLTINGDLDHTVPPNLLGDITGIQKLDLTTQDGRSQVVLKLGRPLTIKIVARGEFDSEADLYPLAIYSYK